MASGCAWGEGGGRKGGGKGVKGEVGGAGRGEKEAGGRRK